MSGNARVERSRNYAAVSNPSNNKAEHLTFLLYDFEIMPPANWAVFES